ncbi:MAG TPA: hypothetical protein VE546_16700 [Streptomyces sp.]|uniref:hypothetical protein n=1 Tax=Streptomyces sp. TaxID=1931 RepID=UPI002D2A8378|nr:hypothetical protein [Streptomyces sp.]HZG05182.1 hypothetical protein [Streptomyces sp.]
MSTGLIITLIVAAVAVLVLALYFGTGRRGPRSLRRRFGPEYERTVAQHGGDTKAAEKELQERLQRHGELRMQPLTPQEREQYAAQWAAVQERFVDAPAEAVAEADRLLGRLAEARGFPGDGYDEQVAALSVHHPRRIQGYREMHAVAVLAREGQADTERLREALVHARALYEDLMAQQPADAPATGRNGHGDGRDDHHGGPGGPAGDHHDGHRDGHADGEPRHHGRLSEKLHAFRMTTHRHDTSRGRA